MALDRLCLTVLLAIPDAVELSTTTGAEKRDRLDGSIWSGLSWKGLDRRSNVVESKRSFWPIEDVSVFLARVTSENPRQTGEVRAEVGRARVEKMHHVGLLRGPKTKLDRHS